MRDAAGWDDIYAQRDRPFTAEPDELVSELVTPLPPGRALDLAAGTGRHAVWMAERGWHVTAVDFSRTGLDRARERAEAAAVELECVHADLYSYDPAAAAFDLVLLAYMHPAVDRRAAVFATAAAAVARGGHLLAIGLDADDPCRTQGPSDLARLFTPARLEGAFPGIELSRCERVTRERETPEGIKQAIVTFAWGRRAGAG